MLATVGDMSLITPNPSPSQGPVRHTRVLKKSVQAKNLTSPDKRTSQDNDHSGKEKSNRREEIDSLLQLQKFYSLNHRLPFSFFSFSTIFLKKKEEIRKTMYNLLFFPLSNLC